MAKKTNPAMREGYCPVYDIECPGGSDAATSCDMRFEGDYNPLVNFRDAEIEHCAIYRKEQQQINKTGTNSTAENGN